MVRFIRQPIVWVLLLVVLLLAVVLSFFRADGGESTPFSSMLADAQDGQVELLEVSGNDIDVRLADESDEFSYETRMDGSTDLVAALQNQGVDPTSIEIRFTRGSSAGNWFALLINLVIPAVFLVVAYFAVRAGARQGTSEVSAAIRSRPPSSSDGGSLG